jgi:alginate O-acetyltransferase complex protein AlgI
MFSFSGSGEPVELSRKFVVILGIAIIFSFMAVFKGVEAWQNKMLGSFGPLPVPPPNWGREKGWGLKLAFSLVFLVLCLSAIISTGFNPFIYFRF